MRKFVTADSTTSSSIKELNVKYNLEPLVCVAFHIMLLAYVYLK